MIRMCASFSRKRKITKQQTKTNLFGCHLYGIY